MGFGTLRDLFPKNSSAGPEIFLSVAPIAFSVRRRRLPFLRLTSKHQGDRGPAAGGDGDELILAVREAAFEIELERFAARSKGPGAVRLLCLHQELHAALVDTVLDRQTADLVQSCQDGTGGVGVTVQFAGLAPAAVLALALEQFLRRRLDVLFFRAGDLQGVQAKDPVLRVLARRLQEPVTGLERASVDGLLFFGRTKVLECVERKVRRGERARLGRRPLDRKSTRLN